MFAVSYAQAQQALDTAALQRIIAQIQQQRDTAMVAAAVAEARAAALAEDVQRLKAEKAQSGGK